MRQEFIDSYGPLLKYPPVQEVIKKRGHQETFFKVCSVAFGVIGAGGSIAAGVVLIMTGAHRHIVLSSLLIPAGLLLFVVASVLGYAATDESYRNIQGPSKEQVQEAFRERGGPRKGEIDAEWKQYLARRPHYLGSQDSLDFLNSAVRDENTGGNLSDDWRELLHSVSLSFDTFLFKEGFYGKRWAQQERRTSFDSNAIRKVSPLLCKRVEINCFFESADKESYIYLLTYLNNVNGELLEQYPDVMRSLTLRPPIEGVEEFLSSEFVRRAISHSEEGSKARSAWEDLLRRVNKLDETPERQKKARTRALAQELGELEKRQRVVKDELDKLRGVDESLRKMEERVKRRAALPKQGRVLEGGSK